jgi:hypothetical protein
MKVISVSDKGIQTIIYDRATKNYYYGDGTPVPESEQAKFRCTVFKKPPNPPREFSQEERDAYIKGVHERARQGLLKKPTDETV